MNGYVTLAVAAPTVALDATIGGIRYLVDGSGNRLTDGSGNALIDLSGAAVTLSTVCPTVALELRRNA